MHLPSDVILRPSSAFTTAAGSQDDSISLPSSPQASLPEEEVSIDELFDMAIRSDRDFSPQPGFAVLGDAEGEDTVSESSHPGILIPV